MDLGKTLSASSAEPVAREERPKRMPFSAAFSSRLSNIPCPSVGQQKNGRLASWPKFLVDTYKVSGEFPASSRPSVLDHHGARHRPGGREGRGGSPHPRRRSSGCGHRSWAEPRHRKNKGPPPRRWITAARPCPRAGVVGGGGVPRGATRAAASWARPSPRSPVPTLVRGELRTQKKSWRNWQAWLCLGKTDAITKKKKKGFSQAGIEPAT